MDLFSLRTPNTGHVFCISHSFSNGTDTRVPQNVFLVTIIIIIVIIIIIII